MAFQFKRKESVRKAVRRLAQRGINKALGDLAHCGRIEAVHEVRKEIKQLRALLRVVRAAMNESDYRRYSKRLREAARLLAAARDARVRVSALAGLTSHFKPALAPRPFRRIRSILAADCRKEQAEMSRSQAARDVGRILKSLFGKVASLRLERSGWSALGPGVQRSFRAGRQGYQLARKAGSPDVFHEWRKRVKDLYYQVGLLRPIWPEQMAAAEAELRRLGQWLGDDHDLVLLAGPSALERLKKKAADEADALGTLVGQRHKQLRARALALGAKFYNEKPSIFRNRLEQYWKRWRRGPKRVGSVV
jgi:CHAD domain-containing protein